MTIQQIKDQIQKYQKLADRYNESGDKENYNYYLGKRAAYDEMLAMLKLESLTGKKLI